MNKKQLFSIISLLTFLLGIVLWLFVGGTKFVASENVSYSVSGIKMIFGFTVMESYGTFLGEITTTVAVSGFRFFGLLILIISGLSLFVTGYAIIKKKDTGMLDAAFYIVMAVLILVFGLTMANGYTSEMLESISNIEKTNDGLGSLISGVSLFVPYWKVTFGTFLAIGFSLVAAVISVYSHFKIK